jgi:ketosteroid isomerase-like protein
VSQENAEIVRRAYTLDVRERPDAVRAVMDPEVEFYDHDLPDTRVYRGIEGLLAWQHDWGRSWETSRADLEELIEAGDRVISVVRVHAKGRRSGIELEREEGVVWTVSAGKVVRVDYYGSRREAFKAVGLEE